jgi:hypothetical protein
MALKFAVNNSLSAVTTLPTAIPTGSMTLLQTQTASSSATIDFTSNIDNTYDSYVFKFINIHPQTNDVSFDINFSTDGGSNYNVTKTTTVFRARHKEDDTFTQLTYDTGFDLAQSTSNQPLSDTLSNDNDANASGNIFLFNPSSTTYVKHFICNFNALSDSPLTNNQYVAGYGNTTSAINAIRFQMSSGNIDDGIIKMYGVA